MIFLLPGKKEPVMKSLRTQAKRVAYRLLLNPNVRKLTQKLPFFWTSAADSIAPMRSIKSTALTQAASFRQNYSKQRT